MDTAAVAGPPRVCGACGGEITHKRRYPLAVTARWLELTGMSEADCPIGTQLCKTCHNRAWKPQMWRGGTPPAANGDGTLANGDACRCVVCSERARPARKRLSAAPLTVNVRWLELTGSSAAEYPVGSPLCRHCYRRAWINPAAAARARRTAAATATDRGRRTRTQGRDGSGAGARREPGATLESALQAAARAMVLPEHAEVLGVVVKVGSQVVTIFGNSPAAQAYQALHAAAGPAEA